ncbi:MAG: alpha/beta hydrolase [Elusimicrobiales bacterium]
MAFVIAWIAIGSVAAAALIVAAAYLYSKRMLRPPHHRAPVAVFPDQFRLPHQNTVFTSEDGITLRGWFIPADNSPKTIILLHGWGNNRGDALAATHFLHEAGFNLLYFDFRCCGESGGAVSTVGYLETRDMEAALEYLKTRKPECAQAVGVYGMSMGAAVAVYAAARHDIIKCVALEAAFDSYEKAAGRYAWTHLRIPYYPFVPPALMFARMKLGTDPEKFSPQYHIRAVSPRPVLFIHGSHDALVPLKDAKALFEKAGQPKEFWTVAGASHAKCAETGGAEYRKRLTDFFTANLKG